MTLSVTHDINRSDGADHDEFMIDTRPIDRGKSASRPGDEAAPEADPTQPMVIIGG